MIAALIGQSGSGHPVVVSGQQAPGESGVTRSNVTVGQSGQGQEGDYRVAGFGSKWDRLPPNRFHLRLF